MDVWRGVGVPSKDDENQVVVGQLVFYLWKQFVRSILGTSCWGSAKWTVFSQS